MEGAPPSTPSRARLPGEVRSRHRGRPQIRRDVAEVDRRANTFAVLPTMDQLEASRSRRHVLGPLGAIPVPESGDVVRVGIPVGGWHRRRRWGFRCRRRLGLR